MTLLFAAIFASIAKFSPNARAAIPLVGDEPSYMGIADSLYHFHTPNLTSELQTKRYRNFYFQDISLDQVTTSETKNFPKHGIGWSLILAPLFAISNDPRIWAILLQNAIMTLLILNVFLWLREAGHNFWLSLFVPLALSLTIPLSIQTYELFSEPIAALCLVYALRKFEKPNIVSIVAVAFLPWIHIKYLVFYPILFWPVIKTMLIWLRLALTKIFTKSKRLALRANLSKNVSDSDIRSKWLIISITAASLIVLAIFNNYAYGTPLSAQEKAGSFFSNLGGLIGSLVNRSNGLFSYAPIYILIFLGYGALWTKNRNLFWKAFLVPVTLWFVNGIFESWHGGQAAPARMILSVLPIFAIPLAEVLALPFKWLFRGIFMIFLAPSIYLGLVGRWEPVMIINRNLFEGLNGFRRVTRFPFDWERFFPLTHHFNWANVGWAIAFIVMFVLGYLLAKNHRSLEKLNETIDHYPGI